jgi:hypothetical protein
MVDIKTKVGQGAHIEGNGKSIDIIVTNISGTKRTREADLKINGVPGLTNIHLKYNSDRKKITDGIEIGIITEHSERGGKWVNLYYVANKKYLILKRKYD